MKTLTIKQPWATLICLGIKDIENRSWSVLYRGPLLIHASATEDTSFHATDLPVLSDVYRTTRDKEHDRPDAAKCVYLQNSAETGKLELKPEHAQNPEFQAQYRLLRLLLDFPDRDFFRLGSIIGQVELETIVSNSQSSWAEKHCKHWVVANPVLFDDPITSVKGRLRLWEFPIEKHHEIRR